MEKNIAFRIENDYVGYLDLGFYNIPLADDYEAYKSFYSFSSAIRELFNFLESDNGKAFCVDNPKSNFYILKFYATGKKDNRGKSVITEKIVFKISAKEVENLRKLSSLENGGYTDLSKSKPEVINERKMAEYDAQIPEIDIEKIRTVDLDIKDNKITSLDDSIRVLKQIYDKGSINAYEEVKILFLDNSNKVIGIYNHSKGGITGTVIDVEMVCALALKCLAKGVIMSHNHPSGSLIFSNADITMTKNLKNALNLFNIALLDSIVITEFGYTSMTNEGILAFGGGIRKAGNRKGFFDGGGEVEFIEYKDSEIMYEPNYKKYYANDMEFDTLKEAKKFIDSGEVPYFIKDAYSKGLFAGGGSISNFDPMSLVGKTFYSLQSHGKIINVRILSDDNIKIKYEVSNTFSVEKSFTKKELFDMAKGKEVDGNSILKSKMSGGGFMDGVYAGGGDFPDVGETVKGSDIDYDIKDYFNRTNKRLLIITKDNKVHTGSVSKFYNDLIFIAKDKFDIPVKDILKVKILK